MESSSCIPWLHRPLSWPCHGILLLLLKFDNWPSLISFVKRPLPNFSLPPLSSFEATASLILECGGLGEGGSWCLPGLFKYQQQHYFFFFSFFYISIFFVLPLQMPQPTHNWFSFSSCSPTHSILPLPLQCPPSSVATFLHSSRMVSFITVTVPVDGKLFHLICGHQ